MKTLKFLQVIFFIFIFGISSISAQTVLYTQNFEGSESGWTMQHTSYNAWDWTDCYVISGSYSLTVYNYYYGSCGYIISKTTDIKAYKQINVTGYNSITMTFKWKCYGESSLYDYGQVGYSLDGSSFTWLTTGGYSGGYYYRTSAVTTQTVSFPTACNNRSFYFAFRWKSDNGAGTAPPFIIDDISISGTLACTGITSVSINPSSTQTICQGQSVNFTATPNGSSPYTYQWKKDGSNAPGTATNSSYSATAAGSYSCYVTNCSGANNATSAAVSVNVNSPPAIDTQPQSPPTIAVGTNTSVSVISSDATSYQWQVNNGSWSNITGAGSNPTYANWTTATLNINNVAIGNNGYQYRCILTKNSCTITSDPATLSVAACSAPSLTAKANDATGTVNIAPGADVNLAANPVDGAYCNGNGDWVYSWYDGSNYWGGTSFDSPTAVYNTAYQNITDLNVNTDKTYTVYVQCQNNASCTSNSNVSVQVVLTCDPPLINAKANGSETAVTIANNTMVQLTANPGGGANCSGDWVYAWRNGDGGNDYWNGTSFTGDNTNFTTGYATINVPNVTAGKTFTTIVKCSDDAGCTATDNVVVSIGACSTPSLTAKANGSTGNITIPSGDGADLTANPSGGDYCDANGRWQYAWTDGSGWWNGSDFSGGSEVWSSDFEILSLTNITTNKTYSVKVKCSENSGCASGLSSVTVNVADCSAPTITAKANGTAGSITVSSGSGATLTANPSGGSYCNQSGDWVYAWTDGSGWWNGTDFSSATALYDNSYSSILATNIQNSLNYTVKVKCENNEVCINQSSVIVYISGTIFTEGFESGTSGWTLNTSGRTVWERNACSKRTGSYGLNTADGTSYHCDYAWDQSFSNLSADRTIDLTNYSSATLTFYYKAGGSSSDYGSVFIDNYNVGTGNHGNKYYTQTTFAQSTIDLTSYCGASRTLKFAWTCAASGNGPDPGFVIDDIVITGSQPLGATFSNIALLNTGGTVQLCFNNSHITNTTPIFRVKAATSGNFDKYQIEVNTNSTFTGTAYTQTYTGTYANNTEYNLTFDAATPSFTPSSGTVYYVRVRASGNSGTSWSSWTTTQHSFIYDNSIAETEWYQDYQQQYKDAGYAATALEANASNNLAFASFSGGTNPFSDPTIETGTGWSTKASYSVYTTSLVTDANGTGGITTGTHCIKYAEDDYSWQSFVNNEYNNASQQVDLTGITNLQFDITHWRNTQSNMYECGIGRACKVVWSFKVIVGNAGTSGDNSGTEVYNWTPTTAEFGVTNNFNVNVDISSYGFSGTKTVKFSRVVTNGGGVWYCDDKYYLDNIRTSSVAPTTGTYTSAPAYLNSFNGALGWTNLKWNQTLNGGTVIFKIQKYNGSSWVDVAGLTNLTATGDGAKTADISSCTDNQIRIVMTMTQSGTSPVVSNWALTASACTAPTLTAKANNTATTLTVASGTSVNFTAGETGGVNCSDYFEYAWSDGSNFWNGTSFGSATAVYNASYNNIIYTPTATTATYTVTARCHASTNCLNNSQVIVGVATPPATISATISSTTPNGTSHYLTVNWTAVSGITTYGLEYSTNGTNWTNIGDISAITYEYNAGDNPNAPYYFRVRSKLNSVYSGYATMATPVYTACDVPATPTVDVPTGNTLNITLATETPVANPAITTYSIYCTTTSQYVQADGSLGAGEVFQTKAQWATITVTGLTSSTQYCFYPKAKNNDGDVRYQSATSLTSSWGTDGIEDFDTYTYVADYCGTQITDVPWIFCNLASPNLTWTRTTNEGCSGNAIKYATSAGSAGSLLRSALFDATGQTSVTVSFDMTNSYNASYTGDNIYMWVGDWSYGGGYYNSNSSTPTQYVYFDHARNCERVQLTFNISTLTYKQNVDIGFWSNSTGSAHSYNVVLDNFNVTLAATTACGTTLASSPDINVKQESTNILSAGSYDFGSLQQSVSGSPVTFTIENLGNLDLNLTGSPKVAISGTNAGDFVIDQTSVTSPLIPTGTTTFTITFTPGGIGARTAQISIANNDAIGSEAPYLINLTGIGTAAPLCGTYTVGATGDFANLAAVAAALAARPVTCDVFFELQDDYSDVAIASTVNFTGWTNTGGPWTVTIRPATGVTALTAGTPVANTPLISLAGSNCKYLIFDGRAGGTGSTIAWTIQNRATASIGPVFNFINDATYNTLQYMDIQGGANSTTANMQGNVDFGTTTATTGNDNNTVTYCKIHEYSTSYYPKNAIYAAGTSGKANDNITITYNEIYNFTVYGIYGATGVAGPGNNWDIQYNHFYNTTNVIPTSNFYVIYLAPVTTSTGHKVSNNFIGGHGRNCADPIWDVTSSSYTTFCLIYSGQCADMEIKNNTLQNIYRSTTSGGSLSGIEIGGTGAFTIEGNTIGHNTDAAKGLIINTQSYLYGIYNSGAGTLNITNNTIANLQSTYAGASADMYGIYTTSGINTISGNIIHDLSANNTNTSDLTVAGIYNSSVYSEAVQAISGNTIYNLHNTNTASLAHKISGIYHNGASAVITNIIEKNNIYNISLSTSNAAAEISGIKADASYPNTIYTYKNNMIRLGYNSAGAAITTGYSIMGINIPVNTYSNFYHNSIYIGGTGVSSSSPTYAFYTTSTATTARQIQNNIFWNARSNGSGSAKNYAIKVYTTTGLTSNYNILYANGTGNVLGVVNTTDYADFTAWKGIGQDANSKNVDPNFVNATSATPDLHLQSPTDAEATGTNIASVTDDFDGHLRSSFTPTDIGADANNFVNCIAPLISVNPANASKCIGENIDFTVTASGTAPLIYQWFKQNKAIDNATQSIYSLSNISKSDINEYYCVITNACGSITSDIATISINNFEIQFHPADVTIKAGKIASFSIAVTGNGISYLWQENKNDGNGWQNLSDGGIYSGVLTNKLIINEPNTTASLDMNNYQYQCVVNSSFCSGAQISDAATLTVNCCGEPGLWAGIIDDKWEVEDNWTTGVLPNLLTDVTIPSYAPNQPAIYSGVVAQCKNINILPRASLILKVGGTLNAAGNMEIESDNTGTGAFKDEGGTVNITGTATIETFIKNKGYHYISNPVNGADLTQINDDVTLRNLNGNYYNPLSPPSANKMPNFWMIDEPHTYNINGDQNAWKAPYAPDGKDYVMEDMRGYALIVPYDNTTIDLSGSGNSFNTGVKTYNVTKTLVNTIDGTTPGNGWHLIGNPYPCPLDWDEIEDDLPVGSKISSTIAFFYGTSMYYGAWGYYNPIIEGSGSFPHNQFIPSMQGFYVSTTATEDLSFNNTHKTVDPAAMATGFYKKNTYKKIGYPLLRLQANAEATPANTDETVLYFISSSTSEYDPSYDGLKLMNTAIELPNIYTYTELENKLSINAQPSIIPDMQIRLGFQVTKSGKFTINATEISNFDIGTDIFLVDTKTGVTQNLRNNPVYKFAINTGDDDNRFFIKFTEVNTSLNGVFSGELFNAYSNDKNIRVNYYNPKGDNATIYIYNLEGRQITAPQIINNGSFTITIDEPFGIYFIKVVSKDKVFVRKLHIK